MAGRQQDSETEFASLRQQIEQLHIDFAGVSKALKDLTANGRGLSVESARDAMVEVRDRARRTAGTISHTIEDRPWSSALVLFGVGILVGNLLSRRH